MPKVYFCPISMRFLKKPFVIAAFLVLLLLGLLLAIPHPLFDKPLSTLVLSSENELLGAKIADDGQWRFELTDTVPHKFEQALLLFEDEHFYHHVGINPISIARAFKNNIIKQKTTSGGSTITMQVARIARGNRSRNIGNKLIEMCWVTSIELWYSKREILAMYATHAPFGGNVVGIEAASWRYFAKRPHQLSWSESALLAVLPNAPSLIFPGKNHHLLLEKRNNLLVKLFEKNIIKEMDLSLALAEELPEKPYPLPQLTPHLLTHLIKNGRKGNTTTTTIKYDLQQAVNNLMNDRKPIWEANSIRNAAVLILDTETSDVLAYSGNIARANQQFGSEIDMMQVPRSTGSILKPLLYAAALQNGSISPKMLIPDIPVTYNGYSPKNYALSYEGAVEAQMVVARSLNVPSVRLLKQYGVNAFHDFLKKSGFTTFNKSSAHYGLSLILGGGETTLAEVCEVYANYARHLNCFANYNSKYFEGNKHTLNYLKENSHKTPRFDSISEELKDKNTLSAASIYQMFEAMIEVNRPDEEVNWHEFMSSRKIAWKTGTSFGNRDGWAIGITPKYIVGVWVGNASNEGSPLITGIGSAAPLLFDVLNKLNKWKWFDVPYDDMIKVEVCKTSGYKASALCEIIEQKYWPKTCVKSGICPYHQTIYTNKTGNFRLNLACANSSEMVQRTWFVLPPAMEYYYKQKHLAYISLPPWDKKCQTDELETLEIIYPNANAEIFLPKGFKGIKSKLVLQAAHQQADEELYWHVDDQFIQTTKNFHQVPVELSPGNHLLLVTDEKGNSKTVRFSIINPR